MRITVGALRCLVERALMAEDGLNGLRDGASSMWLAEADDDEMGDDMQSSKPSEGMSLDMQVDRYLIQYEKAAGKAKNEQQVEGLSSRHRARAMTRSFLLREADDDDSAEDKDAALPADVGGPQARGAVDVELFAGSVARLIENFDNLIEVRRTIVKRAEDFLRKSHSDDDVQWFLNSMRDQHGIDTDESSYDREINVEAPPAVGAGVPVGGGV